MATTTELLNSPDPALVASTVLKINDPSFVPILMDLLKSRPEIGIRLCVIHKLGRLQDHSAFEAMIRQLDIPEVRSKAVEALDDLGDPRAIPYLEPLLDDMIERPEPDERGATLRICDLADAAIRRLRRIQNQGR